MYIQKAEIKNIRSITDFEIEFPNPAGWHVLIGDNGAGKSTIIRSIALALIGDIGAGGLREDWNNWLNKQENSGNISLIGILEFPDNYMLVKQITHYKFRKDFVKTGFFRRDNGEVSFEFKQSHSAPPDEKWFSVAYGPFRRFEGSTKEWENIFNVSSLARLAAHISAFGEDVALTETTSWLIKHYNISNDPNLLHEQIESKYILEQITKLINYEDEDGAFLPNNAKLESIDSKSVFFRDGNGTTISVNQMSDGYRSILSMTFELIRQLVRAYGSKAVFKNIEKGKMEIDLPGVVLVDEIDAHLHPTWQTRIGNWFLKYFPKLQFIVTTHSPLVCRAAERGSIWRLAAPGSDEKSGEVTGLDRERLIYGNVLDAYGTGVFGDNTSISEDANELLNRLSELNVKSMMGLIDDKENEELEELRAKFPTENAIKR